MEASGNRRAPASRKTGVRGLVDRLDDGEFQEMACKNTGDLDMIAGMGLYLVLGVEKVHGFAGVINKDVLCPLFDTTLGAFFVAGVSAGSAAARVSDPAFPGAIGGF